MVFEAWEAGAPEFPSNISSVEARTQMTSGIPWTHVPPIILLCEGQVEPLYIARERCGAGTEAYVEELLGTCQYGEWEVAVLIDVLSTRRNVSISYLIYLRGAHYGFQLRHAPYDGHHCYDGAPMGAIGMWTFRSLSGARKFRDRASGVAERDGPTVH